MNKKRNYYEMEWTETYNKYKGFKSMKEFWEFVKYDFCMLCDYDELGSYKTTKDIWGYLVCFAEMKGYKILLGYNHCLITELVGNKVYANSYETGEKQLKDTKQAMRWGTNKFFEVCK